MDVELRKMVAALAAALRPFLAKLASGSNLGLADTIELLAALEAMEKLGSLE